MFQQWQLDYRLPFLPEATPEELRMFEKLS